jgi:hypothetical protein
MKFFKRFTVKKGSVVALFLLAIFGIGLTSSTLTYADVWTGRPYSSAGNSYSYFDNKVLFSINGRCATGGVASVLPETYAGMAIPSSVNSVATLVAFLKSNNQQSTAGGSCTDGKWRKAGSAYIVQSMLGRTGDQANANGGRNISNADFDDLTRRLNAASINWSQAGVSTNGLNTQGVWNPADTSVDISHFQQTKTNTAIVISSAGGNVYKIFRQCANPVGVTNGIAAAPQDYALSPTVTADRTVGEPGQPTVIGNYVNNTGHVASSGTQWQLSQFVVPAGDTLPVGGNSPAAPAQYYGNNLVRLDGGANASYPLGNNLISAPTETLPDVAVGSRVCYAFSVQPRAYNDGQWAHSPPICVVIAKRPQVQVLGGDLRVGAAFTGSSSATSNIQTSVAIKSGKSYGSWDEYGLFASGTIAGMGSGSAFSGGMPCVAGCAVNNETFTNEKTPLGGYISATTIPDVASRFATNATTPTLPASVALDTLASGTYKAPDDFEVTMTNAGSVIAPGHSIIINAPNATVTISSNITYSDDALTSVDQIPQVVIIAKSIKIKGSVTRIDSWLIANASIYTCSDIADVTALTISVCNQPLLIDGPIMTNKLYLWRSAGADVGSDSSKPAETINLRPDAYLWGIAQNANSGRLTTVYETELPPRF